MARKKKSGGGGGGDGGGWIVTFSDLMTLLLTFFVLLLSMASMDATKLQQIGLSDSGATVLPLIQERFLSVGDNEKVPERVRLLEKILRHPSYPKFMEENPELIKNLLFPEDMFPPELFSAILDENLLVLAHPEGIVIVFTGGLLFEPLTFKLDSQGETLLEALLPILQSVSSDVNISGYTDNEPGRSMSNDHLSTLRAMAVLDFFLKDASLMPERFSVSGYGADWPMFDNATPMGRAKNRRVEVLLKTNKRQSGY